MTYILLLVALSLSAVAAWYAIVGLMAIFAASAQRQNSNTGKEKIENRLVYKVLLLVTLKGLKLVSKRSKFIDNSGDIQLNIN